MQIQDFEVDEVESQWLEGLELIKVKAPKIIFVPIPNK